MTTATKSLSPDGSAIDVRKVRRGRRVRYVASVPRLGRTVLGDYETAEEARSAGYLMLAMVNTGPDRICTPADIDRVRRELAKTTGRAQA